MTGGAVSQQSRDGAGLAPFVTAEWPEHRIAEMIALIADGLTYEQIGRKLKTTKGAIAGKCYKMGLRRARRTREQTINAFAEALSEVDCIKTAGAIINVSAGDAKKLYNEICRRLGWQAA